MLRQVVCALAMLVVPATAQGQVQAFGPPAPFGPLTLGMTQAAARGALPDAEWDEFVDPRWSV